MLWTKNWTLPARSGDPVIRPVFNRHIKIEIYSDQSRKPLWEKEKHDGYQHFQLFPQGFQNAFFLGMFKGGNVW